MDERKEKNTQWLSVPQFGEWDQNGPLPDYSMDFSKIREIRKQNKKEPSRAASLGNEDDLNKATHNTNDHRHHTSHKDHSPSDSPTVARRSIFSYFNCCVKA